ncbi:hypothetical protein [Hyphobacterium indicum]|uniref:hypothetical protein n=1 Tax=Hyphobacterium indicum TaxID=2162714 RepID=UPI000D6589D3|nr:hypothetical protein [Hyphobacterium indicum]
MNIRKWISDKILLIIIFFSGFGAAITIFVIAFGFAEIDFPLSNLLAQWMIAATALIGVILLWKTLSASRAMVSEAQKTTSAAEQTVEETRRIGQSQTRAYLTVSPHGYFSDERSEENLKFGIEIKNSGNSPAFVEHIEFGLCQTDNIGNLSVEDTGITPMIVSSDFPIGANENHFAYVHFAQPDHEILEQISNGEVYALAFGKVSYRDVFDELHYCRFFYQSTGSNFGNAHSNRKMPSHNDSD